MYILKFYCIYDQTKEVLVSIRDSNQKTVSCKHLFENIQLHI